MTPSLSEALKPTRVITASKRRFGQASTVKLALKEGAKAYVFTLGEGSPFDAAVIGSSLDVIKLLVKNGARPTSNTHYIARVLRRQDVIDYLKPYF